MKLKKRELQQVEELIDEKLAEQSFPDVEGRIKALRDELVQVMEEMVNTAIQEETKKLKAHITRQINKQNKEENWKRGFLPAFKPISPFA